MPELPEVEVVRRGLAEHVVGRQIRVASVLGARIARRHLPGPADLAARVTGARIEAVDRRGKYLWLVLRPVDAGAEESAVALIVHLGMSGQLLVEAPDAAYQKHLHARFEFADAGSELRFVDQRTFGGMALAELVPDCAPATTHTWGIPAAVTHIAPDLLEPAFDQVTVIARLRTRHTAVKRALLDQGLVSGIGNIYADEALWRARIHGEREAASLTRPALGRLLDAGREVMMQALEQGGTSFDALYLNVNGASGYFDRSLNAYGQQGRPCRRCGAPIRREAFMNRSSFACPVCQPRPRRPAAARRNGSARSAVSRAS
jgi:formamidopyrimidine-DNA glycosylase